MSQLLTYMNWFITNSLFQVQQGLGWVGSKKAEADELLLRVEGAEGGGVRHGQVRFGRTWHLVESSIVTCGDHSGTRGWLWEMELTRTTTRAISLKRRRWENHNWTSQFWDLPKLLISPRLSSWSRRRKQSSKIRKKIQDETKHSFDQWICLKLKVIRCSTVHELDLLIVRIHCYGQVHLDPNWPIIIIRLFWWFSLVNQYRLGKLTGSKLENVQCILYINL